VSGRQVFFTPFEEDQEMKKFLLTVALASLVVLADSQWASARRGGCGGGRHGGGGGCGMGCGGYGGGCGMMMGGCGMGGCGMMMGGCGMGGCGYGGYGGYVMGGAGCPGGVCSIGGGGLAVVQVASNEATLIVSLPQDATLTIDGEETTSTSAQRVFVTPALEEGKEYEYTLKAKVERDGKVEIATTKVTFRAGETKPVELKFAQGVAAQ
jgi:uncharacterized protein (TIGR03000 family)